MRSTKIGSFLLLMVGAIVFVLYNSLFIVQQGQKAVVLQLGKVKNVYDDAGLKFKIPFVQEVVKLDKRLQGYILPPLEVNDAKQKKIVVNLYVRYMISDPVKYIKNIGSNGIRIGMFASSSEVDQRLNRYAGSAMRNILGRYLIHDLLSENRNTIMQEITSNVKKKAGDIGLNVFDVRIIKANLPKENSDKVFTRMESDRIRVAKRIRAEGEEIANKIKAEADRDAKIMIANANRDSEIIRGKADAKIASIYAKAFQKDPEFFEYIRSLKGYETALKDDTSYVISPNSEFFKYFSSTTGTNNKNRNRGGYRSRKR